jgi:4-amino-4-deoxy-L-arabinose transferase-like glycosyltransferase
MSSLFKNKWVLSISGVVCLLSGVLLFSKIGETNFSGDESGWISSGNYYSGLLLKGDFRRENWICPECGPWGSLNMPLGKLLIGIPLRIVSQETGREFSSYYDWGESHQENLKGGKVPSTDILLQARRVSAAFGVLCCLLIFAIGYFSHNVWTGLIAALLLLINHLFITSATRAMTDVHYSFFLLSLAVSTFFILKARKKSFVMLASSCSGILAGLAGAVKITGIIIGGSLFLAVVLYKGILGKMERRDVALSIAVFSFLSVSTIYLSNPYFWPSFSAMNGKAISYELHSLSKELATGKVKGSGIRERYPQLSNLSNVLEFPNMFLRWRSYMRDQRAFWKSASWNGNRFASFHQRLLIEYPSFFLEWIFLVIGIATCYSALRSSLSTKEIDLLVIPFLYFVVNYVFILTFMELNWSRYYLPTVIASKVLIAVGIYEVTTRAYGYVRRLRSSLTSRK